MTYEIRKPSHLEAGKRYPALFVMHGLGSNEQDLFSLTDGLEEQFFIFSVRGHLQQPPGYAYFTIEGLGKPHKEVFTDAIARLSHFNEYAEEQYPIGHDQLYLMDFSQGAVLSMTLGLTLGNRIKGIVALSGYLPGFVKEEYEIKPVDQQSLFISHGEFDNILPHAWGQRARSFMKG
ncbi:alpha/beta hydrolase [Planococcus lenghuensis]|uniref:alpha/beta hydrolase n=1 Tax=Planococcus lenghuensis TaxID=2213202 RepID=UPI001E588F84|nr:esterase [Planococcus lenghuensis]